MKPSQLLLIFLLVPLGPFAVDMYLPSIPHMVEAFSATDSDIQFTISIYVVALGISQLIAGPLSDKHGRKFSAITGLIFYTLGSLLVTQASSLHELYFARIFQGIGAAFTMVTSLAWIRDHYEGEEAGKWLSYIGGMISLIPTVAPLFGGLLTIYWGWQSGFWVMTITSSCLLIFTWMILRKEPSSIPTIDTSNPTKLTHNLTSIFTNRQFLTYSTANLFAFGGILTYVATAPIVAMKEGNMTEITFALVFGMIGLLELTSSLLAPKIVSIIGQRRTVITGLSLSVLAGIGLFMINDDATYLYFLMSAIGGFGFAMMIGTSTALNLQPFKHCAGLATSIDGFFKMVGGASIAAVLSYMSISNVDMLAIATTLMIIPMLLAIKEYHSIS
jgi:DHA1 family bicyclomycin/chloramphenicol resistance-like MFS transporter